MSDRGHLSFTESGQGPAVIFLHGIGGGARSWAPQLAELGADYRAIALDLPGYGTSPPLKSVNFACLSAALLRFVDEQQIDTFHLVGHSIGGMIAQEFVANNSNRLKTLTLSATSPAFGRPDGEFQRAFIAARMKPLESGRTMADVATTLVPELTGPEANKKGLELAHACMSAVLPDTYRTMMECLVTFDRKDNLPNIQVPTLLLAGSADTQAPAAMMERMASKIPNAQFHCMDGLGHLANLEAPDTFNSALSGFLADHEKGDTHVSC
ncbi:S33 family peptidase [Roseibium sp. TrichSKD4]|uniref:alpha/beta fold hydrolase n=1 Tax=Roseibium sp. TrichSKD4 TaxID=744980 RepID=UPI0001E56461|nr:alpha/beta hydrolase [Roseibium sp. TrichSKD4]EFO34144.1 S33 family peptidase [Roseibium sp. TrichSKD4]